MRRLSLQAIIFMLFLGGYSSLSAQNIYTFAGISGARGYTGDGGYATLAHLASPRGVATDATGNVYFCDAANDVIRKVNTAGIISTLAGTGAAGYSGDGGAASAAQLSSPLGIAIDAAGNIYIADQNNDCIRKINTSGIISTIAGVGGTAGFAGDGGAASTALLSRPNSVMVSPAGNIYISDAGSAVVRMINTSGIISTFAGDTVIGYSGDGGPATAASIDRPVGLAMDASGNVYIADASDDVVRKVNTSGVISTFAGTGTAGYSGDGGAALSAQLSAPTGLVFDGSGNLYIADYTNNVIRKVNTSGVISTYAGNGTRGYYGDGGAATSAELNTPFGLAIFGTTNFYIADYGNNVIRRVGSPVMSITIATATGDTVCGGGPVHFSATAYADAHPNYQWQVNGANVGTDSSGYTYTPLTGDRVVCMLEDSAGTTEIAISETLRVDSFPNAGFILGPSSICIGSAIPLRDSITGAAGGPPTGTWLNTDTTVASLTRPSLLTGLSLGTDVIYYIATNVCGSDSASLVVNVATNTFGPISGPASICANDTATFTDPTAGGAWTIAGVGGGGGGGNNINNASGLFTAGRRPGVVHIAYGTPGCVVIDSVTVIAAPRVAPITGLNSVYDGLSITLSDTSSGGVWSASDTTIGKVDGTGDVTGVTSGIVVITYSVTNIAGCSAFRVDSVYVLGTNGVATVQNNTSFSVFPNPASGSVTIRWNGQNMGNCSVVISDVTGREVLKTTLNINKTSGQLPMDISTLKTGVYMIAIKSDNGNYTNKLIIE